MPYTFLCVGELTQIKRFDIAIRAFAQAFPDRADVVLRIGGAGPEASSLARTADQWGVSDRVQFPGRLSRVQVRDEMRSADAFILSSAVETFGLVVAEAQSVGLPAVVTECGGPEDIVSESTGVRVPPDNVPEMARAMGELFESRADWASRTSMIREKTRHRFDSAAVAEQILACYKQALG
jgi:glycosyltransferase involved in cell wall biosynthesis